MAGDPQADRLGEFRAAVWTRIALSAGLTIYFQLEAAKASFGAGRLAAALASFVLYQLPFAYVLWAVREKADRFAIWLALALSLAGIALSLVGLVWSWRVLGNLHPAAPGGLPQSAVYLASTVLSVAVGLAVVVTAFRARQGAISSSEGGLAVGAAALAVGYTAAAWVFSQVLYRLASWR